MAIPGISGATGLDSGKDHVCAIFPDGSTKCWGYDHRGECALGDPFANCRTPKVAGDTNVQALGSGWDHTCALRNDGSVQCAGENGAGELGNGTNTNAYTPVTAIP